MRKLIVMTAMAAMMSTPAFAWSVVGGGTGAVGSSAVNGTNSYASAATIGGAETSFHEGGGDHGAGVQGQTLEGSYSTGYGTGSYSAGSISGGASGGFGLY